MLVFCLVGSEYQVFSIKTIDNSTSIFVTCCSMMKVSLPHACTELDSVTGSFFTCGHLRSFPNECLIWLFDCIEPSAVRNVSFSALRTLK